MGLDVLSDMAPRVSKQYNVPNAKVYHVVMVRAKKADSTNILVEQVVWHWLHTNQHDVRHQSRN